MRLNPDTGQPESSDTSQQRGHGLHWRKRAADRRSLIAEDKPTPHRDEMLTRAQCIAGLRRFWFQLPQGSKRPLARHLRITVESLRRLAKMDGGIPDACRKRLSAFLMQHARGEWECKSISPDANPRSLWIAGKPSHVWIHNPSVSQRIPDPQWIQAVERDAREVVFRGIPERLFA